MRNVYLDTTIPSFLVTTRTDPVSAARREVTQAFWRVCGPGCRLYVSDAVVGELDAGTWEGREKVLAAIGGVTRLPVTPLVKLAAETYVGARLMPAEARGDAFHLALASVHAMDALLTWNVRHLANPRKVGHLTIINRRLGLPTPVICTPGVFMEESDV